MISESLAAEVQRLNELVLASIPRPSLDSDDWSERRACERSSYSTFQLMAPYQDVMPPEEDFYVVLCYDLSKQGVSFFWPVKPTFNYVVMGLGNAPDWIYLTAAVCRSVQAPFSSSHYLVGCRFTGRLAV